MFSVLNPLFMWAGLAMGIPLVLHMIQSSRTVKMPFSTIRFLKLAEKKSSRRIKMENFLLWILRTILMMVLTLAFMMPMVRTKNFGNLLRKSQRDIAIIIDASYSMEYTLGKEAVWDRAVECVAAVLESLSGGDQVCIFIAEENTKPLYEQLSTEFEAASAQVKGMKPSFSTSQLAPAVMAGNDALKEEKGKREREIHIITDTQLLPWTSFGGVAAAKKKSNDKEDKKDSAKDKKADKKKSKKKDKKKKDDDKEEKKAVAAAWDPSSIEDKTAVFVTMLGATTPENIAPVSVDISPKLLMADTPSKIMVRLTHSGPARNTSVTVFIDDIEKANRSVIVGASGAAQCEFAIPPLAPGNHTARVELPIDNLPSDNIFHFMFKVKDRLPTLCIGNKTDALFLMKAMNVSLSSTSAIDVKLIAPTEIGSESLGSYSCIFLCNALPISGQEILDIEHYVQSGGLLVIFPGNNASAADYAPWTCLPAKPISIAQVLSSKRKKMLRWEKPQHPLLRQLKLEAGGTPIISVRKRLRFGEMEKEAQVLVSAGTEDPFILDREFGNGRVVMINVSADREWSSFPLSPFYLPIVHEIVQYGAGIGGFTPYIWTTKSMPLLQYLPSAKKESGLKDPDDNDISIRSAIVNSKTILHAENLTTPGVYTMLEEDGARVPAIAVNMPRDESNMDTVDANMLQEITGLKNLYISQNKEDMLRQIEDHRIGKTFGEQLLWLALILSVAEFFYANMMAQGTPKLSELLGIETTGKVSG